MIDRHTKQRVIALYNALTLDEDMVKWMSNMWQEPKLKELKKKIDEYKRRQIIDVVSTQEELDLARLTLDGNEEVFGVFEAAWVQIKSQK